MTASKVFCTVVNIHYFFHHKMNKQEYKEEKSLIYDLLLNVIKDIRRWGVGGYVEVTN